MKNNQPMKLQNRPADAFSRRPNFKKGEGPGYEVGKAGFSGERRKDK